MAIRWLRSGSLWALASLALCASMAAHAERTLKVSLQLSIKHPVGANIVFFKNEVEKNSNGAIKIEIHDSAELYKGREVPQAVASGAIDMGLVLAGEYAGDVPAAGLFSVAFMFPGYEVLAKAAAPESPVRRHIDELILATGSRVLWWQDFGPVQLLSRQQPIVSPKDLRGKKVRVLDKPTGDFISAVGGLPVTIGGSEQFAAYGQGAVDVGMTGTTAIQTRKLYDVMNYVTITNHAQTEFLVIINEKLWESMSNMEKEWISTAARNAEESIRRSTKDNNQKSEAFIARETPMKVVNLDADRIKAWQEAAAPAVEAYIRDAGEVGERLVEEVRKLY